MLNVSIFSRFKEKYVSQRDRKYVKRIQECNVSYYVRGVRLGEGSFL